MILAHQVSIATRWFDPAESEGLITPYAPLLEPALLGGFGPCVAESGIGLITNMTSSAPYEDLRLKAK